MKEGESKLELPFYIKAKLAIQLEVSIQRFCI